MKLQGSALSKHEQFPNDAIDGATSFRNGDPLSRIPLGREGLFVFKSE